MDRQRVEHPKGLASRRVRDVGLTNLPEELTSFVGRVVELGRVRELLGEACLLTLVGAGGCGKTRLALQSASRSIERFPDGICWVERAAEKVVYGEITTGAESDIQQLTQIARGMVGRWGMSDAIGPLAVADRREDGPLLPGASPVSPATQQLVDDEAKRIVECAEREVVELLQRERPRLDALAHALLKRETLDQHDAYEVAGIDPSRAEIAREAASAAAHS